MPPPPGRRHRPAWRHDRGQPPCGTGTVGRLLWLVTAAHMCAGVSHWRLDHRNGSIAPMAAPATPPRQADTVGGAAGASIAAPGAWRLGLDDAGEGEPASEDLDEAFMRLQRRQQGVRKVILHPRPAHGHQVHAGASLGAHGAGDRGQPRAGAGAAEGRAMGAKGAAPADALAPASGGKGGRGGKTRRRDEKGPRAAKDDAR